MTRTNTESNLGDRPGGDGRWRRGYWPYTVAVALCSFVVYYLTAFRTITWWENAQSVLVAMTLGVAAPPGMLIPTILGWLVTRLHFGPSPAFTLNLLAGAASSATAVLVCYVSIKTACLAVTRSQNRDGHGVLRLALAGIAIASLSFSFSETIWTYSTKFTTYIFTGFMTVIILWALLKWWENADSSGAERWLFIVTLFLGMDFSVHRTNVLVWPAVLVWILLRKSRTILTLKSWLAGAFGLALGLAFNLLLIPIAARRPFLNLADPSSLTRFWDYISLKQMGGGWLINVLPRKADFLSVQLKDYLDIFALNFLPAHGPLGALGILPFLVGLTGIFFLWRRNRRLAMGLIILFLCSSLGAVIYFNVPEHYFRQMDRHYMPSFLIFGVWVTIGLAFIFRQAERSIKKAIPLVLIAFLAIAILPAYRVIMNYARIDGSHSYFARDFGRNLLNTLPDRAILFTSGDNDTFPLWYLQEIENLRPDVTVVNLSLLNASLYVSQLKAHDPGIPLTLSDEEIRRLAPQPWSDTTIIVSAKCDMMTYEIAEKISIPDSIGFHLPPTIAGKYILVQDWLMMQMIINNAWKRPIYYSVTVSPVNLNWVKPYLRYEGLAQRLMPVSSPPLNSAILRRNLFYKYTYNGYRDENIQLDDVSRMMAMNYFSAFIQLAYDEKENANIEACEETKQRLLTALPLDRFEPLPAELKQALAGL